MEHIILADISGSMEQDGKGAVARYLLYAIEALYREEFPDAEYRIFLWNDEITEYDSEKKIVFQGKSSAKALDVFLSQYDEDIVLLLAGDGTYSDQVVQVLSGCKAVRKFAVMVGADGKIGKLQRAFGKQCIYDAADIASCIHDLNDS